MKGKKHDFSKIKLFLSDVDGVLTDGGIYYSVKNDIILSYLLLLIPYIPLTSTGTCRVYWNLS